MPDALGRKLCVSGCQLAKFFGSIFQEICRRQRVRQKKCLAQRPLPALYHAALQPRYGEDNLGVVRYRLLRSSALAFEANKLSGGRSRVPSRFRVPGNRAKQRAINDMAHQSDHHGLHTAISGTEKAVSCHWHHDYFNGDPQRDAPQSSA
jgi:hypothetical protein